MKISFVLEYRYAEAFECLSDEDAGALMKAIFTYETKGEIPELSPVIKPLFVLIKSDLDLKREAYDEQCEKNRINGSKGGRPKEKANATYNNEEKPDGLKKDEQKPSGYCGFSEKPKKADNDNDNDIDIDNDIEDIKVVGVKCAREPISHYENLWGTINPTTAEAIMHLLDGGLTEELICTVFDETQAEAKRFKYAEAILLNCIDDKVLTLAEFRERQRKRREEKKTKPAPQPKKNKFLNFESERTYDFDAIEKKAMQKRMKGDST